MRLPMDNAERLVAKAYEWIDQASHELSWDESYTKSRKGETKDLKKTLSKLCALAIGIYADRNVYPMIQRL